MSTAQTVKAPVASEVHADIEAAETDSAEAAAEAEAARLAAEAEAEAEAAAAAEAELRAQEEAEAAAAAAAEAAAAVYDPTQPRSIALDQMGMYQLLGDGPQLIERVQQLVTGASVQLLGVDENGAYDNGEIRVEGPDVPGMDFGELCARCLVASLKGEILPVTELPDGDDIQMSVLEIPEAAGYPLELFQPKTLVSLFDVVAGIVQLKEEPAKVPKKGPAPAFARALGLQVGIAVEGRYDDSWFHAEVTGFSDEREGVIIQWLGGDEAELSPIDVRISKHKPPPITKELPGGRLVIFGSELPRTAALLHTMAIVERKVPRFFSEQNPPQPSTNLFGFGIKLVDLPLIDGGAVARQRPKIAAASEAIVEVLGRKVVIAGEADERRRAEALVTNMVPHAGPFGDAPSVPSELEECCSRVRVPALAVTQVAGPNRSELSVIEDETDTITFWLPVGTAAPARSGSGAINVNGVALDPGSSVKALFEGEWHPATLLSAGSKAGKVRISWDFDGSNDEVPANKVRPLAAVQKQRQEWLKNPRVLVVFGSELQRRACVLRVMSIADIACLSVWSSSSTDLLSEVRDGARDTDLIYGVEVAANAGTPAEQEWGTSPEGVQGLRRAAVAAGCVMEYVGKVHVIVGLPNERELGRQYARWAVQARGQGSVRKTNLSVPDADMREDITILLVTEARAPRLRLDKLLTIERETNTLILFDDGGGASMEIGLRRLLICGSDAARRDLAIHRLRGILDPPGAFDTPSSAPAPPQTPSLANLMAAPTPSGMQNSSAPTPGQAAAPTPTAAAAEAVAEPDAKKARKMSNPKEVLATMAWPSNINQWGSLQNKIWEGHPKLPQGWIRVWSKSQDSEYFLRLKDMKTTFAFSDVSA